MLGILAAACASNGNETYTEDVVEAVPFESGERLVYELVDAAGKVVGRGIFTATIQDDTFVLIQSYEETDSVSGERPILDVSTAVVDRFTLKPLTTERSIQRRNAEDDESYSAIFRGEVGDAAPVSYTHLTLPTLLLV